jgi:hypothetical protein
MGQNNMSKDEKQKAKSAQIGNGSHRGRGDPAEKQIGCHAKNHRVLIASERQQSATTVTGSIIARAPLVQLRFEEGRPGDVVGPGRGMRIFRGKESPRPVEPSDS